MRKTYYIYNINTYVERERERKPSDVTIILFWNKFTKLNSNPILGILRFT